MNQFLRILKEKLLYSNIIIASAASLFVLEFFLIYEQEINTSYLRLIFYITLAHYSLHRLVALHLDANLPFTERTKALKENYNLQIMACSAGLFIGGYLFLIEAWYQYSMLYFPFIIGILYTLPLLSVRIRDWAFLKVFLVALVWAWIAVVIPNDMTGRSNHNVLPFLMEKFLFIVAITIPFDIRDLKRDSGNKVKTIANHYGIQFSQQLSLICLVIIQLLNFTLFYTGYYNSTLCIANNLFYAATFILLNSSKLDKKGDGFYLGILDGSIILHGVLVILFH